jgi:hypothetical protein
MTDDLDDILGPEPKPKPRKRIMINVTPEVFEAIQKHAKPLVDTPDSVLRRLLGLPERPDQRRKGAKNE